MDLKKLILASSSPKRQELLKAVGFKLIIINPNINETQKFNESPKNLVLRLSNEKAQAVSHEAFLPIIAADTVIAIDNEILGKPKDELQAFNMLTKLSGKIHKVFTGYTIRFKNNTISHVCDTTVTFRDLAEHEIYNYIKTSEWKNKSGACSIQGSSCQFVVSVNGSFTNILGLPLIEFLASLASCKKFTS